jgi:hypothetical protein
MSSRTSMTKKLLGPALGRRSVISFFPRSRALVSRPRAPALVSRPHADLVFRRRALAWISLAVILVSDSSEGVVIPVSNSSGGVLPPQRPGGRAGSARLRHTLSASPPPRRHHRARTRPLRCALGPISPPALLLDTRATAEPRSVALVRVAMSPCMLLCSARSYASRCGPWLVACSMVDITSKPPCMLLCLARSYVPISMAAVLCKSLWTVARSMFHGRHHL